MTIHRNSTSRSPLKKDVSERKTRDRRGKDQQWSNRRNESKETTEGQTLISQESNRSWESISSDVKQLGSEVPISENLSRLHRWLCLPQSDWVIEIDGSNHHTKWETVRDKMRDAVLETAGFSVLHIRNSEVEGHIRKKTCFNSYGKIFREARLQLWYFLTLQ